MKEKTNRRMFQKYGTHGQQLIFVVICGFMAVKQEWTAYILALMSIIALGILEKEE